MPAPTPSTYREEAARSGDLENLLRLARRARDAHRSARWRTDIDAAIEEHGDACDQVWEELYRLLDAREADGAPVPMPKSLPDPRKLIKREVITRLKSELPEFVASIVDAIELDRLAVELERDEQPQP
jgi:hypothetical protein